MSQTITVDVNGLLPLKRQLQLLAMPKPMRRRLLNKVVKKVITNSKARVSKQVDLNGRSYAKHSKGRKRKMLLRLARLLKVIELTGTHAKAGFYNPVAGRIAAKQQHGSTQTVTANSFDSTSTGSTHYDKPATRKQAKALRDVGYRINKRKGKKGKKPSLKWVTSNLTVGQAGVILKKMRIEAGDRLKQRWQTKIPARSFLGASQRDISTYIDQLFKQITNEVQHGIR